jgi:hypothetical protein
LGARPLQDPAATRQGIAVLRSASEIETLREFWETRQTHRGADIDFYLSALAESSSVVRPHVIVSYEAERPRAMLIGRLDEARMDVGDLRYLRARLPKVRTLTFLYQGWVGDVSSADSDQFIGQIIESLRAGEATMAVLDHVDIESPLYRSATTLPGFLIADHMARPEIHRARQMTANEKTFLASLSSRERNNQKRRARRLAEDFPGGVRIECLRDVAQVDRFIQDAESIAATSFARGLGRGFSADEAAHRSLELEARKGVLRGFVLYLDDRPCSFWLTSLYKGTVHSQALAFDPHYRDYAPGMYLLISAIGELADSGGESRAQRVDFGFGDFEFKRILSNESWHEASVRIFAPNERGFSANVVHTLAAAVVHPVKARLQGTNFFGRLQRSRGYRALGKVAPKKS